MLDQSHARDACAAMLDAVKQPMRVLQDVVNRDKFRCRASRLTLMLSMGYRRQWAANSGAGTIKVVEYPK